jgi:glycerol-3-phosphate acyltransferase PlsY
MNFLIALGFALLGYLCGSLPFAVWVTRLLKGTDVRAGGSRHATATNTMRQAGWAAGILVLALDIAKGYLPIYLAKQFDIGFWGIAATAGMVVVGHCWPVWAGFRGGMGLAAAGGTILAVSPLGLLIGVALLITLVLVIHHSARASVLMGLLLPWVLWVIGLRGEITGVALATGLVIAVRFLIDWNRRYRELWLDRPEP